MAGNYYALTVVFRRVRNYINIDALGIKKTDVSHS
jgi:hypothetical protein